MTRWLRVSSRPWPLSAGDVAGGAGPAQRVEGRVEVLPVLLRGQHEMRAELFRAPVPRSRLACAVRQQSGRARRGGSTRPAPAAWGPISGISFVLAGISRSAITTAPAGALTGPTAAADRRNSGVPSARSAPRAILPSQATWGCRAGPDTGYAGGSRRDPGREVAAHRACQGLRPGQAQAAGHRLRRRRRQQPVPPAVAAPGHGEGLLARVPDPGRDSRPASSCRAASPARSGSAPPGGDGAGRAGRGARAGPRSSPGCSRRPRPAAPRPSAAGPCGLPPPPRAAAPLPLPVPARALPAQRPSGPAPPPACRLFPSCRVLRRALASRPAAASRAMRSASAITASASSAATGMQDWSRNGASRW